jgi:hypothetical protein
VVSGLLLLDHTLELPKFINVPDLFLEALLFRKFFLETN